MVPGTELTVMVVLGVPSGLRTDSAVPPTTEFVINMSVFSVRLSFNTAPSSIVPEELRYPSEVTSYFHTLPGRTKKLPGLLDV